MFQAFWRALEGIPCAFPLSRIRFSLLSTRSRSSRAPPKSSSMAGMLARRALQALRARQPVQAGHCQAYTTSHPPSRGLHTMSLTMFCKRPMGLKDLISSSSTYPGATEVAGGLGLIFRRWATKKTAGSTKNGRDSNPKFLGVKKFGGEKVIPGNIIVRQRGTRFHPGNYVGIGKDHTLFALKEGHVRFERHKLTGRKWVHVDPSDGHVLHPIYTGAGTKDNAESELC